MSRFPFSSSSPQATLIYCRLALVSLRLTSNQPGLQAKGPRRCRLYDEAIPLEVLRSKQQRGLELRPTGSNICTNQQTIHHADTAKGVSDYRVGLEAAKTVSALRPASRRDGTVGSVRFARLWNFGLLGARRTVAKSKIGVTVLAGHDRRLDARQFGREWA